MLRMTARTPRLTPLVLGTLGFTSAVAPLAIDMYLPSFGRIQHDLGTTAAMVQLTLSVFLLGTAAGQLLIGPLSDRLGRRRPLLAALGVFAIGSIALIFTPSIEVFIGLRLLLGFVGAAGIVLARAIAADLNEGETAVRALSLIAMVGSLGPLIAPPIGGLTQQLWGWRGTLATLAVIAVLMLLAAALFVPESLPRSQRRTGGLFAAYSTTGSLVRSPRYVGFVAVFALGFAAMFAYISASSFVGQNLLGMTPIEYSLGLAAGASAFVLTSYLNARIAPRVGPARMMALGIALLLVAGALMLGLALSATLRPWSFIVCAFVLSSGASLTMSNASALALAEADHARGLGAALMGGSQFVAGGAITPVVGAWGESTALPMAVAVIACASLAAVCGLLAVRARRRG